MAGASFENSLSRNDGSSADGNLVAMLNGTRTSAIGGVGDLALVELAAAGDAAAFDLVLRPRLNRLFRMAVAITRSEPDARDATQEACVLAWRELPRLREHDRFDPWLSQILVNSCRMLLRSNRRGTIREISMDDPSRPATQERAGIAAEVDQVGETEAIQAAFARLDPAVRSLLVLHYVEGRPLAEIASVMRSPVGTIKWRLSNARDALEKALKVERR
jgi:RNA polymerase sigma-70 factor (ECF subfamily)